jgi:hypothetical protein
MRKGSTVFACFALLLAISSTASAQEATPATGSPTAEASRLTELGYLDLVLQTDGSILTLPDEVEAGRYRLVIENSSADLSADLLMGLPPEGTTTADAIAAFEAAEEQEEFPELFSQMIFVGGVYAFPATTDDAIVTLSPGEYVVNLATYSETDDALEGVNLFDTLNVTGELPALEDPEANIVATAVEMGFEMPDSIPAGPQIWEFTNAGAFQHHLIIESYPTLPSREQVQATLDAEFAPPGTPEATPSTAASPVELLNVDDFTFVGQGQPLSTGQTSWFALDLEPGYYVAFCFFSGPGDVPPHALLGMFQIFTVE